MKIIKFYEEYGEEATKEAFGADRKVISRWRKRIKESGGRLIALVPESTRPHKVRRSEVSEEIIAFIGGQREKYPRLGKEKLKPLLDKYCKGKGIKSVSESTIGNIIKRNKFFFRRVGGYIMIPTLNGHRTRQRGKRDSGLNIH